MGEKSKGQQMFEFQVQDKKHLLLFFIVVFYRKQQ